MPDEYSDPVAKFQARITRLEALGAGFTREFSLIGRDDFLSSVEREAYLAAINRVLLSLGEARQVLVNALRRVGGVRPVGHD